MDELVSIIIPTYNREKTIKRAVDSCLQQTYKNIEIIIVDDCSTDKTEEIIKNYEDNRIRYIKLEKNSGACVARNTGIKNARGRYIAFQDSDDSWQNSKIEKQLKNMEENNSTVDFCRISVVGEKDNQINIKPTSIDLKNIKKYGIFKALCFQSFISTQSVIGEKKCFMEFMFDETLPRLQDYDLMLRISKKYKISITEEPLANLYVQDDSISKNNQKLINASEIMLKKNYNMNEEEKKIFYSKLYRDIGNCYKKSDKEKMKTYFKKSLESKFSIKVLLKIIIQ